MLNSVENNFQANCNTADTNQSWKLDYWEIVKSISLQVNTKPEVNKTTLELGFRRDLKRNLKVIQYVRFNEVKFSD